MLTRFARPGFHWCLALLLAACAAPLGAPQEQRVSFMIFGDPAERDAYRKLVGAFQQRHADILVDIIHVPSQSEYRTRLVTEFASGAPPDVSLINYRRFSGFAANGVLEPLGPYLDRSAVIQQSDFYPAAIESFTLDGTLICIPQNISSLVVYYNQDLFDAAGLDYPADNWTWDDFLETAQALTRDIDGDGTTDQYGLGLEPSLIRAAPFIWQNGGRLVDEPLAPTRLALARLPALEALQFFVDLQVTHGVVPGRVAEASQDSESRFVAGQTAMFLNSRRGTPAYREIKQFTWDVAPLPQGKQQAGVLHSDAYCLARAAQNKDAAWTFIEFANSPEGQQIVAESGRTVPSLRSVAEGPAFLTPDLPPRRSAVFLQGVATLQRVPLMPTWEEIERIAGEEIERAFYGDISVEAAARAAVLRTEEYFVAPAR